MIGILEFSEHKQKCEEKLLKLFIEIEEFHTSELKQINSSLSWN
jgi:hypothetical protein